MRMLSTTSRLLLLTGLLVPSVTAAQNFTDIPQDNAMYPAVLYMAERGMVQHAPLFRPNDKLTREQAAKVIVTSVIPPEELAKIGGTAFKTGVSSWAIQFVEAARLMGVVKTADDFRGGAPITRAEYSKMLLAAQNLDFTGSFGDLQSPISSDVNDPNAWFFPVMRFAVASSMVAAGQDGKLNPNQEITRGQMALLTYRLATFRESRRTQALLSQTEGEIANMLKMQEESRTDEAEYAAARAVLSARGALLSKPEEPIVKAAVKVAEGFQWLMRGFRSGLALQFDQSVEHAKAAYAAADKADSFSPNLKTLTDQMRQYAKKMADDARAFMAQQAGS